jgi:hypothetical protein
MATCSQYVRLCDVELEAAESAATKESRIGHLEKAYRYARLAVAEGAKERVLIRWPGRA